ncbi:MAG: malto-oligosyltrehalose synthase [Chitinophagales bacterium]|nr:malto-oligosyltrehalose synthase [Chitinophagales bacterium]
MMYIPTATYRIQFSKDFTFKHLLEVIPYLHDLGISTIYASPIFKSRKGSTHGYDVCDPNVIDSEIGRLQEFKSIVNVLRKYKMGWLQDIVPNHMAFDAGNPWLMDIFEQGPQSPYYHFFDIDWDSFHAELKGKVQAPFLGGNVEDIIEKGELEVVAKKGKLYLKYYALEFPLSASTQEQVRHFVDCEGLEETAQQLTQAKEALKKILELQYYHLADWHESDHTINYRRFFTVSDLICLSIQYQEVFDKHHELIKNLCEQDMVQGLRVDHIDGLYNPQEYLLRLRQLTDVQRYLIVEKILEWDETLPRTWPIQGSSGYQFLAVLNNVFTKSDFRKDFSAIYHRIIGGVQQYEATVFEKKHQFLLNHMRGELDNLHHLLVQLLGEVEYSEQLKDALAVWMAAHPVYRTYIDSLEINEQDRSIIEAAFAKAVEVAPELKPGLSVLYELYAEPETEDEDYNRSKLHFFMRCQQFTGPLAAKGVEDTTFYTYNRLISHNEVGDSPDVFGINSRDFHQSMKNRWMNFPHSLNATATHDTKRGEDARMCVNVLSEMPQEWEMQVREWMALNADLKTQVDGEMAPSTNDEYFLYQTLVGVFPMDGQPDELFRNRIKEYLIKAVREGKTNSKWSAPNEAYESALVNFAESILSDKRTFRNVFQPFIKRVSLYGALYSLSQLLLKITAPGIPDIYQGCELWDLSMVDPDNRRPVDFSHRAHLLKELQQTPIDMLLPKLTENVADGRIKLFVLYKAICFRRDHEKLFSDGRYIPLMASGTHAGKVLAFARNHGNEWAITIVARLVVDMAPDASTLFQGLPIAEDTYVELPADAPLSLVDVFTGYATGTPDRIHLSRLWKKFPITLLYGKS